MTVTADGLQPAPDAEEMTLRLAPRARHLVTARFVDRIVQFRFASEAPAEVLRRRYRCMLADSAPHIVAHIAAEQRDCVYFWIPGLVTYRWPHGALGANETAFLAEAFATTTFFRTFDDVTAMHAAALGDGRGVAAIAGETNAGKTTTALACARRGLVLYSDEYCILTPAGVTPFPRTLNLRRDGIDRLALDRAPASRFDAWMAANRGEDRENVGLDELFGQLPQAPARPLTVACALVGIGPRAEATPIAPVHFLSHLRPWPKMSPTGVAAFAKMLGHLRSVACYELRLGTPDETAGLIGSLLAAATRGEPHSNPRFGPFDAS
jgi:hypothetical protein